jgi:SulP family sulfate permease
MAARLAQQGYGDILPVIVVGVGVATAAAGLALYGLGVVRAGQAIRFVPFPVIGGFLGATGLLMMAGAVQVVSGLSLGIGNLAELASFVVLLKLGAAASVALALHLLVKRWSNAYVLPLTMAGALFVFHAGLSLGGFGLDAAQNANWVFPRLKPATPVPLWSSWAQMPSIPWTLLPWFAGDVLAIIFVTTISLLLNATGVELATRREVDVDRELKALGVSNAVTAVLGGYVSCL